MFTFSVTFFATIVVPLGVESARLADAVSESAGFESARLDSRQHWSTQRN